MLLYEYDPLNYGYFSVYSLREKEHFDRYLLKHFDKWSYHSDQITDLTEFCRRWLQTWNITFPDVKPVFFIVIVSQSFSHIIGVMTLFTFYSFDFKILRFCLPVNRKRQLGPSNFCGSIISISFPVDNSFLLAPFLQFSVIDRSEQYG